MLRSDPYRLAADLPHLRSPQPFLADGGLETDLIFHHGFDLPHFASFVLLEDEAGRAALRAYYRPYLEQARRLGTGVVLDAVTWRANPDWGRRLGYGAAALDRLNREAIGFLAGLRDEARDVPVVLSGCLGPRGDGYVAGDRMAPVEAEAYHRPQVDSFAASEADLATAMTMTYPEEAIGIVRAARAVGLPSAVSFTVETDGRLPSGETLAEAVQALDEATDAAAAYVMVNCAHPSHFLDALDGRWTDRVRGVRANASMCSHAELDAAETLDEGDPEALAAGYVRLAERLPRLAVVGGCCGTDVRHVAAIGDALLGAGVVSGVA